MDSRKVQAAVAVVAAIGAIAVARRVANVEGAALGLTPLEVAAVLAIGTTVLARKQGWV